MIYTVEGFSKVDKHRCCNTTFVNAFPNTIREVCNRVLGRMIFFENHTGREIADWTYLNVGGAVFARLFQGSSKPPVKRRWDGSYPYTSYPHLYKVEPPLHISIPPVKLQKKSRDLLWLIVELRCLEPHPLVDGLEFRQVLYLSMF